MSEPVRVGLVGVGMWGQYLASALKQLEAMGICSLVGIAARSRETVLKCEQQYGVRGYVDYNELFQQDLDAVVVATPDHLHREVVLKALARGCHVFVEKPLDITLEGCKEMVEAATKARVILQVDFHKRYDPYVVKLRELVKNGELGNICYVYAYMEDRIDIPKRLRWAHMTDPYWFLGVHKVDALRWILGQEVCEVYAYGQKGVLVSEGIETYDSITFTLKFDKGTVANVHVSWVLPSHFEAWVNQGFRIVGTKGLAEVDTQDRGFKIWTKDGAHTPNLFAIYNVMQGGQEIIQGYYIQSVIDFIYNILQIKKGMPLENLRGKYPDGWDGLWATKIGIAVHKSLLEERPIKIEEVEL